MKKLAVALSVLVVIAAFAFLAIHRRTVTKRQNNEARGALVKPFSVAEQETMARVACGGDRLVRRADGAYACAVCPPGSDAPGKADPSAGGWQFKGAIAGSFTGAGMDEAVVHTSGCESHAMNYGGDFLLRRSGGTWSAVRYAPGGTADDKCQLVAMHGGRDALVCKVADMHQGIGSEAVTLLQFDATPPPPPGKADAWTPFLLLTDDSSNCGFERALDAKLHPIQLAKVESFEVLPENAEGRQDVAIQATITRVTSPAKQGGACPAGEPKLYRLTFHNAGDHFEAAEGYVAVHALHREDCCEVEVGARVAPVRF